MIYLINTFNAAPYTVGHVHSRHKTVALAEEADRLFQRRIKRGNGRDSYMPTIIVELKTRHVKNEDVLQSQIVEVNHDNS